MLGRYTTNPPMEAKARQLSNSEFPLQTGISREVREHHIAQHRARCPGWDVSYFECICGATVITECSACEEVLVVGFMPGTFCEHAADLIGQRPTGRS